MSGTTKIDALADNYVAAEKAEEAAWEALKDAERAHKRAESKRARAARAFNDEAAAMHPWGDGYSGEVLRRRSEETAAAIVRAEVRLAGGAK